MTNALDQIQVKYVASFLSHDLVTMAPAMSEAESAVVLGGTKNWRNANSPPATSLQRPHDLRV